VNGWQLFVWPEFAERWRALRVEAERLREKDPQSYRGTPATKLLAALRDAVLRDIPTNPGAERYRQGKTVGVEYTHWRRASFFERFRLFFRYSSRHRIIVYAWLNDENTLRKRGARTDPYVVFRGMLERGQPPDDWEGLIRACSEWKDADVGPRDGAGARGHGRMERDNSL
jgi:toxin YhaV